MDKIIHEDLKRASLDKVKQLLQENNNEITGNTLEAIGDLVDIYKDITNVEYWCEKEESEMYGEYGEYGARGRGGRRGNYGEYGNYGNYGEYGARRRDSRGRYRGDDYMDMMKEEYGRYQESRQRYGASEETDKSFHYMVKALEDFIKVLEEEAETEQQRQMLRESLQRSMM